MCSELTGWSNSWKTPIIKCQKVTRAGHGLYFGHEWQDAPTQITVCVRDVCRDGTYDVLYTYSESEMEFILDDLSLPSEVSHVFCLILLLLFLLYLLPCPVLWSTERRQSYFFIQYLFYRKLDPNLKVTRHLLRSVLRLSVDSCLETHL